MPSPIVTDEYFIQLWHEYKSPSKLAKVIDTDVTNVYKRRRTLEKKYNLQLNMNLSLNKKKQNYRQN